MNAALDATAGTTLREPAVLPKRIAIVHDWLPEIGGAEAVLCEILKIVPQAHLFSLVDFLAPQDRAFLCGKRVRTSFLQRLPGARRFYRALLPLMPLAVEHFDLSEYDLIISSSYAVAKGVLSGPDQLHLCYCHSPIRYAWDMQESYLKQTNNAQGFRGFLARGLLHYIRLWDCRTPNGVDAFAANSQFVSRRIWKVYRRRSRVIYPPVSFPDLERAACQSGRSFYLTLGRLVPYKRVDLLVEVFRKLPDLQLIVIGDGPERGKLERDLPPNVHLLGRLTRERVVEALCSAKALLFAAEEDFGIVPVEAQAAGTPVIAFKKGGACESVVPGKTGVLFENQSVDSILDAIKQAEQIDFDPDVLKRNAARFSVGAFQRIFRQWIEGEWSRFSRQSQPKLG